MEFLIWVAVIFVGILVVGSIMNANIETRFKENIEIMENKFMKITDFSPSQMVVQVNGLLAIAIDENRKKICLLKQNERNEHYYDRVIEADILSYQDILSSEILVDGTTITKTSRGSQLGGALIGGLVFGGAGAIIGGLSGKTESSNKTNSAELLITVNRVKNPNYKISLPFGQEWSAMEQAQHWHSVMKVIIKQADIEDTATQAKLIEEKPSQISDNSVADEIVKLGKLKEQGLLTSEEFLKLKSKLLS